MEFLRPGHIDHARACAWLKNKVIDDAGLVLPLKVLGVVSETDADGSPELVLPAGTAIELVKWRKSNFGTMDLAFCIAGEDPLHSPKYRKMGSRMLWQPDNQDQAYHAIALYGETLAEVLTREFKPTGVPTPPLDWVRMNEAARSGLSYVDELGRRRAVRHEDTVPDEAVLVWMERTQDPDAGAF